jgi:chromosome segregation ATPase
MNALTPETELTVDAAARLCGRSTKTLDRYRKANKLTYEDEKDSKGRNIVTVGALVEAGLYVLGTESAEDTSRCVQLTAECKQLREEVIGTQMELSLASVQLRGLEKEVDAKDKEVAALRGQIRQLERFVQMLEGFAPKSMTAGVK